jgi:hypothetical protein
MTHQINGLDDLLYIVMFDSKPYAVVIDGNIQQATKEQIFSVENKVLAYDMQILQQQWELMELFLMEDM